MNKTKNPVFRMLPLAVIGILISFLLLKLGFHFIYGKQHVILITVHSLRPDHLSCYGYEHMDTSAIDDLAKEGILFENAYCSVPNDIYSYASILSGRTEQGSPGIAE